MARPVSIVLPALNEHLTDTLKALGEYVGGLQHWAFEIVVVDDSRDDVLASDRAEVLTAPMPAHVHVRFEAGSRSGKGAAVQKGISVSQGQFVFLIDVDMPAPMHCIEEFLRHLENGADVVIAERVLDRQFENRTRWLLSRGLLVVQRAIVFHSREFSDTQCGFKAFRGGLIREIAAQQIVKGGMYDLEYLYVALRKGKRVEKISIVPNAELRPSRINVWKCLREDPIDVLRVKAHGVLRKYH